MTKEEERFTEIGTSMKGAAMGKMFGKPGITVNGKAFACFFQNCMVFKLSGDEHASAMKLKGSVLFDPSGTGRAMKEWVQVPYAHHAKWEGFAGSAFAYVKKSAK